MARSEVAAATSAILEVDPEEFQTQVRADAAELKQDLDAGAFDNRQGIIGFEYEFYAVSDPETSERGEGGDAELGALTRVPRGLLELIGFEAELGLHNAEMCTSPQPMNRHGLRAQEAEVKARLGAALDHMRTEGMRLVSDGLWTIPPAGETAREYLTGSVEDGGITIATNMSAVARYHAMANAGAPAGEVLADAWMEHRISVFETVLNAEGVRKVKFPTDIDDVKEAIDRVAEDRVFVPMPVERGDRFDDAFAAFRTKHGTYWRWVRPVFAGATRSEANARIEFRPIPGQPTVRDSIAFQAAFAGLIEGMHAHNHPLADLDWRDARSNFYAGSRTGSP